MFSHSLVIDEENVKFIMKLVRAVQEAQKSMLIWPTSDFQLIFGFLKNPGTLVYDIQTYNWISNGNGRFSFLKISTFRNIMCLGDPRSKDNFSGEGDSVKAVVNSVSGALS